MKNPIYVLCIATVVLSAALAFVACDGPGANGTLAGTTTSGCDIKTFGNNVFYFECSTGFGPALAEFAKDHSIVTVTSYSTGGDMGVGGTKGYYVVTK